MTPSIIFVSPRRSNSVGEATGIAGTSAGGAARAGTGAASTGGAATAVVVLPAGTDGDTQAAPRLVHRGRAARESSVRDRFLTGRQVGREAGPALTGCDRHALAAQACAPA